MNNPDLPGNDDLDKYMSNLGGEEIFLLLLAFWLFETKTNKQEESG